MKTITELSKQSNSSDIKKYFNAILNLTKSNEEFPVNLREVWMLEYNRKDHAVRDLKKDFIQGVDYQVFPKFGEQIGNSKPVDVYKLSTSCLEYFIARKNRDVFNVYREVFHKAISNDLPQTFAQALRLAADQQEKIEEQSKILEEQKPKVLFAESVEISNDSILIGNLAKLISQKGVSIGQNKLFAYMRENGFLCSTSNKINMPTQKSINQKLMEIKESVFIKKNGSESISLTTMVTGKGQIYFINKFKNQDNGR